MAWHWIAAGIALVIVELAIPTYFFLLSLGVSCLAVGLLVHLGVIAQVGWAIWIFCGLSLAMLIPLVCYARRNRGRTSRRSNVEELIGKEGAVRECRGDPQNPESYLVSLAADQWSARLETGSQKILAIGDRVRVKKVEGVHLIVEKI